MSADAVADLLALFGVERAYRDGLGVERVAPPEALLAVLRALGAPLERLEDAADALRAERLRRLRRPVLGAVVVDSLTPSLEVLAPDIEPSALARVGGHILLGGAFEELTATADVVAYEEVEGERRARLRIALGRALPHGRHPLTLELGRTTVATRLIVAPDRAYRAADHRRWGAFLPLYAAHSARATLPDFTHLAELAHWSRSRGASVFGTLPLFATFLGASHEDPAWGDRAWGDRAWGDRAWGDRAWGDRAWPDGPWADGARPHAPFDPSPYAPVSRRFLNELFIDLARCGEDNPDVPDGEWLDYADAYAKKAPRIAAAADRWFEARTLGEITESAARRPDTADYARFRSALERTGRPPADGPMIGDVAAKDTTDPIFRYHFFAQLESDRQLARVADDGGGLYLDFPLGVHHRGYDAWRHRDRFLHGVSAGAPPDPLFSEGQVWGFSPLHPDGALDDGLDYVASCIERVMEHAHVLRIDHVMGLHRIFCVPPGMSATEGVYVRQPEDPLYALLLEQSVRTSTELVGEDLGTVPEGVRARMTRHDLLRMYVLPFETRTDGDGWVIDPPADALACIDTHDMAPFASFALAHDIDLLAELGLGSKSWQEGARWQRRRAMEVLAWRLGVPLEPRALLGGALELLGASASPIVLVNLEDLWLETVPQNVPGTSHERPNWRRRARYGVDELASVPEVVRALDRLVAARGRAPG